MTFVNASFELAGTAPGEAADWTWTSVAPGDAFADFNAALPAYATARESFEAGWRQTPRWTYANAAARVGSGGFVAADVDGVALQADDDSLWALVSSAPTWQLILTAGNEVPPGPVTARPTFGGSLTGREDFERWTAGRTVADDPGLVPMNDPGVLLLQVDACGLRGAADAAAGSIEALRAADTFDDGWGADPWTGVLSRPIRRSLPLAFPLTLPPERARLWVWSAAQDRIVEIAIAPGAYATAADLCSVINVAWLTAGLPATAYWTAWTEGASTGIALGWYSLWGGADVLALVWPAQYRNSDARAILGLPTAQAVQWPTARIDDVPAAFADPITWVDAHALAARSALASDGGQRVLPPTAAPGSFDATDREDFAFGPWTGGGTWRASLTLATMGVPTWTGGGTYEGFENAAVTWPDYYEA